MLFLRLDQVVELLRATRNLKEKLVIRYAALNGLSTMEIASARIEDLDPIECTLFLPRRHWKDNDFCDIDAETVRLQIIYSGARKKGPLIRNRYGGHYSLKGIWDILKRVARRTAIPKAEDTSLLILKRTFAREWLRPRRIGPFKCPRCGQEIDVDIEVPGGTLGSLQKQLGHKHLSSTAHYLRFVLEDVRRDHTKLMRKFEHAQKTQRPRLVP